MKMARSWLGEKQGAAEIIGFLIITVALFGTATYVLVANAQKAETRAQGLIDIMRDAEMRQGELLVYVSARGAAGVSFSWSFYDPDGDPQAKYQLQVATDNNFSNIIWDSGIVESSYQTTRYAGPSLTKGATYYFRVKVSDNYEWTEWFAGSFVA